MKHQDVIIVKKIKKAPRGHHGGAWKVAYADFVTAMMALFMVLWLIAMMSTENKSHVAKYFRSFSLFEGKKLIGGDKVTHLPGEIILIQEDAGGISRGKKWEKQLEQNLKKGIEQNLAEAGDQVFVVKIPGGIRIEIVERTGKTMFEMGEAKLLAHGKKLLEIIAGEIGKLPFPAWIEGHTDAYPYNKELYTNWELSVDRANSVRKELVAVGIPQDRIKRVIGFAATYPLIKEDPFSSLNRRVSIVIKEMDARDEAQIRPHQRVAVE